MAFVITEPCIGTKDQSCIKVCPVDCIHGDPDDEQLFIDPETCIDCGACESECPVNAIFEDVAVPEKWRDYIEKNRSHFAS